MKQKQKSTLIFLSMIIIALGLGCLSYFGIGDDHVLGVANIKQGLDLKGGVSIVYMADRENVTAEEMSAARSLIQGRLDRRGWTEAEISTANNRIFVNIPGVEDADTTVREY